MNEANCPPTHLPVPDAANIGCVVLNNVIISKKKAIILLLFNFFNI